MVRTVLLALALALGGGPLASLGVHELWQNAWGSGAKFVAGGGGGGLATKVQSQTDPNGMPANASFSGSPNGASTEAGSHADPNG